MACDHSRVVRELGEADARKVWQLGVDGVELLRDRVARHSIDCDLKWGILLVANKARQVPDLHAWQQELGELGYDRLEFHDRAALQGLLRADYHAGVMDWGGGDLHPLKYAQGLARAAEQAGVRIFERSAC
ncbi:FAD-dependent oxidoreductase [Halopseudomonas pachastrellae]|nr:FAD-dependent oxidoreductase [Halopseudomonas pachastrellae]